MNLANKFSLLRLFLTPLFVLSILYHRADNPFLANLPLFIFLLAVATDAIDGYIARRYGQITRLGTTLDPLADKFLLLVAFVTLSFAEAIPQHLRIPLWVLVVVITRDIFILVGAALIFLIFEYIEFKPTILGKLTTITQMLTVFSVLLQFRYSYILWSLAAVLTVLSGAQYLVKAQRTLAGRT